MDNLKNIKVTVPEQGMIKDIDPLKLKENQYTHAINAKLNSHLGNELSLQNEPSNYNCINAPYKIIGYIQLPDKRYAIFSTNNAQSEIGIFDDYTCEYTTLVNSDCLGFKTTNPIIGESKQNIECDQLIYWVDGLNPDRYLNINKVPYKYTVADDVCKTKTFTNELDCSQLNLTQSYLQPCIEVAEGTSGKLKNGSYQVAIAYSVNKQRVTSYLGLTHPINIFSHDDRGSGLSVTISNVDNTYNEYQLIIVYTIDGITSVEGVGFYSTDQNQVFISAVGSAANQQTNIEYSELLQRFPVYTTSENIVATSRYLIRVSPSTIFEPNYQLQANKITSKWVAFKASPSFYKKNNKVGFYRDEVYAFGIRWIHETGYTTPWYHIPGRSAEGNELSLAGGSDLIELQGSDSCDTPTRVYTFEVKNTAKLKKQYTINPKLDCELQRYAEGTFGYYQSTELYPDNVDVYGDNACRPIKHHKFPDSSLIHIHDNEECKDSGPIILGAEFDNIEYPKDSNGNKIPGYVGYEIGRADRKGNETVIARGLLYNTGLYEDPVYNSTPEKWLYPNYPFNDLRPDPFLSSTRTEFNGLREKNFNPLSNFQQDKFTFHSPETHFSSPSLGNELKLEAEEVGCVTGNFEPVYKHPKEKLLTNGAALLAIGLGIAEGILLSRGRKCHDASREVVKTTTNGSDGTGPVHTTTTGTNTVTTEHICETTPFNITTKLFGKIITINPLRVIAFGYYYGQGVKTTMNIIKSLSSNQTYALQYNSYCNYSGYKKISTETKRYRIVDYQYLLSANQEVADYKINNYNRESSVYIRTSRNVKNPSTTDNTRNTIKGFGLCNDPFKKVKSKSSCYYSTVKRRLPNQYGQLSTIQYLKASTCINLVDSSIDKFKSDTVFGGDCYVTRMTLKRKMPLFNNWLYDVPDGFEWDYRLYRNVAFPRYWADFTEYDYRSMIGNPISSLGSIISLITGSGTGLPSHKHNLDCSSASRNTFVVKNRWFYLFVNGIADFYVESDYNLELRDWDDTINGLHYSKNTTTDLSDLFRQDRIAFDNKYIYNADYSKKLIEDLSNAQSPLYDPSKAETCFVKRKNALIYSLPHEQEQFRDTWKVFLPLNYYNFGLENGDLTSVYPFERDRLLFLFSKYGPYHTLGIDTLQTDNNRKIIFGDGGVFAQPPQPVVHTKYGYGASQSKYATLGTQVGIFYPSQEQGRIFLYNGNGLNEISNKGMYYWFKENLPSKLLLQFPNFVIKDNPIEGIGCISTFDNSDEIYYITKRDFTVKEEYLNDVTYDESTNQFFYKRLKIKFKDPFFFDDCSWTASFSLKTQSWISFHDWQPNLSITTSTTPLTIFEEGIWRHNDTCTSFSNFYNVDYPWELELVQSNGVSVSTLSNIEWNLESYTYSDVCNASYHEYDFNFDQAVIYNSEQCSGLLELHGVNKNNMFAKSFYPDVHSNKILVRYDKVEQKYRLNQFWDSIKDRGKNTTAHNNIWITHPNGYKRTLNKYAINYLKPSFEQKKFRHLYHKVILRRLVSNDKKMIFKFNTFKQILSPR